MLKIIRTNRSDILSFYTSGEFMPDLSNPRVIDHIAHALELNTPVIIIGELSKWSDFSKYIALACAYESDIEIHTLHECSLDEISVKHYVERVTKMYDREVKFVRT